jgi:hypothetical protein
LQINAATEAEKLKRKIADGSLKVSEEDLVKYVRKKYNFKKTVLIRRGSAPSGGAVVHRYRGYGGLNPIII